MNKAASKRTMDSPGATSVEFALVNHAAEELFPATKENGYSH